MRRNLDFMPWWRELHARLGDCRTPDEVFDELDLQVRGLGFDCFAHGYRRCLPFSQATFVFSGSYPNAWMARHAEQEQVGRSTLQLAQGGGFALWSGDTDRRANVPGDLRDSGMAWGATVAGWARDRGLRVLCVARRTGRPAPDDGLMLKATLRALADVLDEHLLPFQQPEHSARLSEREVEILRWIADGKCSKGAAQALGLSENTVNWHIKRILRKFKSPNRVWVAARAAALGLI